MFYLTGTRQGTRGKCRNSSVLKCPGVLSQCNSRLGLLHLLYDIEVMWVKNKKHAFSILYTLKKHGFLTNQSARRVLYLGLATDWRAVEVIFSDVDFRTGSFCHLFFFPRSRLK